MTPLLRAAFWTGLCPLGPAPTYEPSRRVTTAGLLLVCLMLVSNAVSIVWDFYDDRPVSFIPKASNDSAVAVDLMPKGLQRVVRTSSAAAAMLGFLALCVGYLRKRRHLPRVFRMKDTLPGKPRWKTILYVFELSVFSIPVSAFLLESFYEERGVSNTAIFAALGTLYLLEKFMFLHLVATVGVVYSEINAGLEALEDKIGGALTPAFGVDKGVLKGARKDVHKDVRLLRQQHMAACELLEQLTRSYEVQVLAILVCEFVLSVLVLYVQARSVLQHSFRPSDLVALLFLLLITQVTTLIYDTCRSTSDKGNKTAKLVHKLLNSRKFFGEETEQLVLFSMQMVGGQVCVAPYDVVTLDYALLHGMMCNVTMHIVILVQFNLT